MTESKDPTVNFVTNEEMVCLLVY